MSIELKVQITFGGLEIDKDGNVTLCVQTHAAGRVQEHQLKWTPELTEADIEKRAMMLRREIEVTGDKEP